MGKTQCSCGFYYDGWSCPNCARIEADRKLQEEIREDRKARERAEKDRRDHEWELERERREQEEEREAREAEREQREWEMELEREQRHREREEAAERREEEHRETIANAWKLQSKSQHDRAAELYDAGLFEDALEHAKKAVELDKGNFWANMLVALCYRKTDRDSFAEPYLKRALVLAEGQHSSNPMYFETVLNCVLPDEPLLLQWEDAVRKHCGKWSWSEDTQSLLDRMISRNYSQTVREIALKNLSQQASLGMHLYWMEHCLKTDDPDFSTWEKLVQQHCETWGWSNDTRTLLKHMLEKGYRRSVRDAVTKALQELNIMELHLYWMELGEGEPDDHLLRQHLETLPVKEAENWLRAHAFDKATWIKLSDKTRKVTLEALESQRGRWQQELATISSVWLSYPTTTESKWPHRLAWLSVILFLVIWGYVANTGQTTPPSMTALVLAWPVIIAISMAVHGLVKRGIISSNSSAAVSRAVQAKEVLWTGLLLGQRFQLPSMGGAAFLSPWLVIRLVLAISLTTAMLVTWHDDDAARAQARQNAQQQAGQSSRPERRNSSARPRETIGVITPSDEWQTFTLPQNTDFVLTSDDPRAEICITDLEIMEDGRLDCPAPRRVSENLGNGIQTTVYFRGRSPIRIYRH